jgi:hypothetical protein
MLHPLRGVLLSAAMLVAFSCGAPGGPDGGGTGGGTGGTGGATGRTVTVSFVVTHVTDTGSVAEKIKIAPSEVQAMALSGTSFRTYTGAVVDAGLAQLTRLPDGEVWLRLIGSPNSWVDSANATLECGLFKEGRVNAMLDDGGTRVSLSVSGLSADGGTLGLLSPSVGYRGNVSASATPAAPVAGQTSATTSFSWSASSTAEGGPARPPLVDATKNDKAYLVQTQCAPLTDWNGCSVVSAVEVTTLNAVAPSPSLTAVMAQPSPGVLSVTWPRASLAAVATQVHPSATQFGSFLELDAVPGSAANGWFEFFPALALDDTYGRTGADTDTTATLPYVNPYPSSWPLALWEGREFSVPLSSRDGGTTSGVYGGAGSIKVITGSSQTVSSTLSPPSNIKINGQATIPSLGVSGTGLIEVSWTAPTTSPGALGYEVQVMKLDPATGNFARSATLYTRRTTVTAPTGIFVRGSSYAVIIYARWDNGKDLTLQPLDYALPGAYATGVSGRIDVQ